jgi:hypothetical protein
LWALLQALRRTSTHIQRSQVSEELLSTLCLEFLTLAALLTEREKSTGGETADFYSWAAVEKRDSVFTFTTRL